MDRKEFLINLGKGTASVCLACFLASCTNNNNSITAPPTNVDFTLDISQSPYTALGNVGGAIYKDGIIIARLSQTSFTAVSQYCTHQGSTVQYESSTHIFHCPTHGSNFNTDGLVINGPAGRALAKYNTALNGTSLRVYS